jgi:hypothetical protein
MGLRGPQRLKASVTNPGSNPGSSQTSRAQIDQCKQRHRNWGIWDLSWIVLFEWWRETGRKYPPLKELHSQSAETPALHAAQPCPGTKSLKRLRGGLQFIFPQLILLNSDISRPCFWVFLVLFCFFFLLGVLRTSHIYCTWGFWPVPHFKGSTASI